MQEKLYYITVTHSDTNTVYYFKPYLNGYNFDNAEQLYGYWSAEYPDDAITFKTEFEAREYSKKLTSPFKGEEIKII